MKVGAIIVALLVGTGSMYFAIWMLKSGHVPAAVTGTTSTDSSIGDKVKEATNIDPPPVISASGPHPKAVLEKSEMDVGTVEAGQEVVHTFVVRNEGEAPLLLARGGTTCQCTLSEAAKEPIPPGQSGEVQMKIKPQTSGTTKREVATILTNDPKLKQFELVLNAKYEERFVVTPRGTWPLGDVSEDKVAEITATITSATVEQFQIVDLKSSEERLSAVATPISAEELKTAKVKSGYYIKATLKPGLPVGAFTVPMTIKTDSPSREPDGALTGPPVELQVLVSGNRRGPITIYGGPNWSDEHMAVTLGTFDSTVGKKVTLDMFVQGSPEEGLQFSDMKATPDFLKVTLEQDTKFKGKAKRYHLTFEFPAGSPRGRRFDTDAGVIEVTTNHPTAKTMSFRVHYNAY